MADLQYNFPFLLAAKGIETPNPLALAGSGLSLADLLTRTQAGQLGLAQQRAVIGAYSNPDILQQLFGPSAPNLTPEQLQQYGPGLPTLMGQVLGIREKQAQIGNLQATAAKSEDEVQNQAQARLGSMATTFLRNPSQQGFQSILLQMAHLKQIGRDPQSYTRLPDDLSSMTPQDMFSFVSGLANLSTSPKDQADIAKIPFDQWAKQAEEQRLWFTMNKPEIKVDPNTGLPVRVAPFGTSTPQMPAAPTGTAPPTQSSAVAAVTKMATADQLPPPTWQPNWQGGPFPPSAAGAASQGAQTSGAFPDQQIEPSATQKVQLAVAGDELKQLLASSQAAAGMKTMLEDLRGQEAQGIFSGGIKGQPVFKTMANMFAAMGWLSSDQLKTLANTQAWDVESKNLVAQAVKQFVGSGGRVAARELDYMGKAKPEDLQTPEGRAIVYNILWKISDRVQQQATQASTYFNKTGQLSDFVPKFVDNQMPNLVMPTRPDPRTNVGKQIRDTTTGIIEQSDGTTWKPIPGQSPLANQIPQ